MTVVKTVGELSELIGAAAPGGSESFAISDVCYNSKAAVKGSLFVAMKGSGADGHNYIIDAVSCGAAVVVAERAPSEKLPDGVWLLLTEDSRKALALIADWYCGRPTERMKVVGVTGTNGKTTSTYIISSVMNAAGRPCGKIGTTGREFKGKNTPLDNTTPESLDLQKMMKEMEDEGASCCAIEVSSHALDQGRVNGVRFSTAAFTNLTQDHLDYHGGMENYFDAKTKLFTEHSPKASVINADDPYGARLAKLAKGNVITYGLSPSLDICAEDVTVSVKGVSMKIKTPSESVEISSSLAGRHNVYNLLTSAAVAYAEGVGMGKFAEGIASLKAAPGRFEKVEKGQPFAVIVDYAHTPDALENVLVTARNIANGKIITVFGCGGDRDKKKRPLMGRVAWTLSDSAIVTSDNPRTEDPNMIIEEILKGVEANGNPSGALKVIPDRRDAIREAMAQAKEGDIVLIAGKGHEDYQIIGKTKSHFDDREEAAKAILEVYGQVQR